MQSDLPHTLYNFKKKDGDKTYNPNDNAFELQRRADERAAERRKARQEKDGYTLDEVFRGENRFYNSNNDIRWPEVTT